jgi:REP-associated tyrosine transposase
MTPGFEQQVRATRGQPFIIDIIGRTFEKTRMARAVRLEFAGACYHVMARGDRREAIVRDDADRATFVRTLAEASERSGFRVHAFVLMSNHYHLLLETGQANLSRGMGWLQNAFTRRINARHGLWGHLFGGRYKAILVEPGNCFWALLDYIHLNPVRVGVVAEKDGLESYVWSSLPHYLGPARKRPPWLETATGFQVCGCDDTASGRREFLGLLEKRVDWRSPRLAGTIFPEGEGRPQLAVYSSLRRGWLFGSERFREKLLKMLARRPTPIEKANGYHGPQLNDYAEKRAQALLRAGLEYFGTDLATLRRARKGDWRKGLIAAIIQKETTVRLDWITEQLNMGTRAGVCRLASEARKRLATDRALRRQIETISSTAILHG